MNVLPSFSVSGIVHRGCRNDMPGEWDFKCDSEYSERCSTCEGNNCNMGEVGGGGGLVIKASSLLINGLLAVLVIKDNS